MRADRLISMLMLLQERGRQTAHAIADELEVSPRTILRDVEALAYAGVPIRTVRGAEGGIELREGFRGAVTGLNLDEAECPSAGRPAAARGAARNDKGGRLRAPQTPPRARAGAPNAGGRPGRLAPHFERPDGLDLPVEWRGVSDID